MRRIILACALAGIFAMPAKALDGTRSPANVPPVVGVPPGDNPDIQNWHNPSLQRAAKELLEQSRQLRRAGDELLTQANPGPAASLRDQLVGAWELVSCEGRSDSQPVSCVNVHGIQVFDASGRYVRMSVPKGRPKFTNPTQPRRAIPAEEYKAAVVDLVANFATWSVNEADKTVTYHIDGALFPNIEGQDFKSGLSLSGDELRIDTLINHEVWRRIRK